MVSFSTESVLYLRDLLWTGPLLILLVVVGLYQTISLKGLQFRCLKQAITLIFQRKKETSTGDISAFQSLMTSLAGAIGTGNIAGIATAVGTGGFGALFWMWIIAFLGMATAYSETFLSVKYRIKNEDGAMAGGPMYTLSRGLNMPKLAGLFALFGAIAAFGIGNLVQANSVAHAVSTGLPVSKLSVGIVMMIVTGAVFLGGIKRIGHFAEWLVPFKAILYLSGGFIVLIANYDHIIPAFQLIFSTAFTGQAAVGGFLGSTVLLAIQFGVSKGVFSNEAGLGSLAIAAASAKTNHPAEQGMLAISGVFISTMLVCTLTGLVLAVTGVLGKVDSAGNMLMGSSLVMAAFESVYPGLQYVVVLGLVMFAFTAILAWGYYGEKCVEYLFGTKTAYCYRWVYTAMILVGALLKLELVWALADLANGFMAIPNLIAILGLSRIVQLETKAYFKQKAEAAQANADVIAES